MMISTDAAACDGAMRNREVGEKRKRERERRVERDRVEREGTAAGSSFLHFKCGPEA